MFPGLIARPLRVSLILLLLVAIGAGIWLWSRAGESTAADQDAAVRDFRAAAAGGAGPRPGVPRAGVYRLRQSGTERGGVGPIDLARDLPEVALYTVTPAPGGYREELDISEEHVESSLLRVGKAGATRRVSTRTKVTFLGVGRDDRRELRPPPLRFPPRLPVGATWSSRYTAGTLPVNVRSRVLRSRRRRGRRTPPARGRGALGHRHRRHPPRAADRRHLVVGARAPCRCGGASTPRSAASPSCAPARELALETLAPRV